MEIGKNTSVNRGGMTLLLVALGYSGFVEAAITFNNATATAGPFATGETYGAAWGDSNGDSRPDLHINRHRDRDKIFRNNGDGTFTDVTLQMDTSGTWIGKPIADTHGGSWADFNGDGLQDLYATNGSCCLGYFFVNEDGVLVEQAAQYGLTDDGGSRLATWVDFNDDGLLDILLATHATSRVWRQSLSLSAVRSFTNVATAAGINNANCGKTHYLQLSDINGDRRMEFVCVPIAGTFPTGVFDTKTFPFQNVKSLLPTAGLVEDTVFADFDNDLDTDLFVVRGNLRPSEALKVSGTRVEAHLSGGGDGEPGGGSSDEKGLSFTANGPITFQLDIVTMNVNAIFIGPNGTHPTSKTFTVDPATLGEGIKAHDPAVNTGIYIGLVNAATQEWQVLLSPGGKSHQLYMKASGNSFSEATPINIPGADLPLTQRLFMHTVNGFADETNARGLNGNFWCSSAVAADFDNDMDMDLYLECGGGVQNTANRLFRNTGSPGYTFVEVANAGGAQGTIGKGVDTDTGNRDAVTVVDYDLDGRLDLYTISGGRLVPVRKGGPDELFHNETDDGNNWILLKLKGTASNPDGIGATVFATTPDGKTQMREQNGGFHRWSQDDTHVHFGLGTNNTADLTVHWPTPGPNGHNEVFSGVTPNKLYQVVEGNPNLVEIPRNLENNPVPQFPAIEEGDECAHEPISVPSIYDRTRDRNLYLWKNCSTGVWTMRGSSGGSAVKVTWQGDLTSSENLTIVAPFSLEGADSVTNPTPTSIHFKFVLQDNAEDGFDFSFPSGATDVCLSSGVQVLLGQGRKVMPLPFNLATLQPCGAP